MRFSSRSLLLVLVLLVTVPVAMADHFVANCPLDFVSGANPSSVFLQSPHGNFTNGSLIYSLRGQRLLTISPTDTGSLSVVRDDAIPTLGARDVDGGVVHRAGFIFLSGDTGLEIFDIRNTKPGANGSAPLLVSRTAGKHYRRLAISGNVLVGLYPASDLPCFANGTVTCYNSIDIFDVTNLNVPVMVATIPSLGTLVGFEDIAFANGFLWSTGLGGTHAWSLADPAHPMLARSYTTRGTFLATNGTNVLGIGQPNLIGVFTVGPDTVLNYFAVYRLPSIVDRSNMLMFHPEAMMEDQRLITMIDEVDPLTGKSARTIAFDVFDFSVPLYEGFDDRIYENVSPTYPDEVKYDPVSVGPYVYVVGEASGLQVWGACGVSSGRIEFDNLVGVTCGGTELHGYVTGAQHITKVELYLDGDPLGIATIGASRNDVSSPTPVFGWRIPVNLDSVERGNHVVRAIATDVLGHRQQFASKTIFFNGPGQNCTTRRRGAKRGF